MNFEFSRWEDFTYGKICQTTRKVFNRNRFTQTNVGVKKVVQLGLVCATLSIAPVSSISEKQVAVARMRGPLVSVHLRKKELSQQIIEARKTLDISQEQAAAFLGLSIRSLQSLESQDVSSPTTALFDKYQLLIEISNYLKVVLGNRKFAIYAAMHTSLSVFGGKSAVEYGIATKDGGNYVLATFHRMYG